MHHRKTRTRAVKSRSNFIQNQQDAVTVAKFAESLQVPRVIKPHAVSTLEHGLANHGSDFILMLLDNAFHRSKIRRIPSLVKAAIRAFRKIMVRHDSAEKRMHSVRIRKRHRTRGVAVVAALQGNQFATLRARERMLVLHRHLGAAFHGDASRICKENFVETFRQKIHQLFAKFNRRFVCKTAEHHMAHLFALFLNRLDDFRGVMPVRHAPPTRYRINQFQTIGRFNRRSMSGFCKEPGRSILQRRIGVPQMLTIKIK